MKFLWLLLWMSLVIAPAMAQDSVEILYAKARGINPTLRDLTADLNVSIDGQIGPIPYRPNLKGKYYFKRSDKHKVDLQNAPGYIKKYGNIFGFHLPQLEKYNAKLLGTVDYKGRKVKKLELIPKVKVSDVERLELYIDPERGTVPKFDTFYGKGFLYVEVDYAQQQGYWVFDKMSAQFSLPSIQAKASGSYGNYQFNQNLPESLFK